MGWSRIHTFKCWPPQMDPQIHGGSAICTNPLAWPVSLEPYAAVINTPKFHHITPILKSLHWLKTTRCIHYKILSITYKCLLSDQSAYIRHLLTVQSTSTSRSSSVVTLKRPKNASRLKVSSRSFYHSAPCQKNFDNSTLITPNLNLCFSSCHLLNFTRNLKLFFSLLLFLANFPSHLVCFSVFLRWLCVCRS
jgi:hypothetical protein